MENASLPAVSPAETQVLRIVWETGEATVQDVCDRLPAERNIAYATVQTLLRRLEKKGYLNHHNQCRAHVFFPAVKSEEVIKRTVTDFLDRLFGGDAIPLVQYLAEHGKIDADDIEKLKALLNNKEA
jgi:predicted transcriptional regulator